MSIRLLTIESRRTIGTWLFPVLAVVAGKLAYDLLQMYDVLLWAASSRAVRDSVLSIGPCAAGAAAWAAGRESRRGLGDLLATTPRPELQRRLMAWAATVLWATLGYLAAGAFLIASSYLRAAWGTPTLWPMLTGLLAVLSHAALGYAFGYYLRSRFTAPLVAIGLFTVQMVVGDQVQWGRWLSPVAPLETTVWYGVRPYLGVAQALFLLGLAGLAWGLVALGSGSRRMATSLLVCAALLTAAGVGETLRRDRNGSGLPNHIHSQSALARTDHYQLIPYTPVCNSEGMSVCVHPAYQPVLPEVTALIDRMAGPLVGVPGGPTRAEQLPFGDRLPAQPGVLAFDFRYGVGFFTAYDLALQLTRTWSPSARYEVGGEAQMALEIWLMQRAGYAPDCGDGTAAGNSVEYAQRPCDAARRFAALAPDAQGAWLTQHYADLRAGKLRLEDLP